MFRKLQISILESFLKDRVTLKTEMTVYIYIYIYVYVSFQLPFYEISLSVIH